MKVYDLSPEISEKMAVYKNRPEKLPKVRVVRTIGEGANETAIDIYTHTGSHVDAPYHILQNGKTIDTLNLDKFMGRAIVLDFTKVKGAITEKQLKNSKLKMQKNDIVLLKTKNKAEKTFNMDFTYLEKSGAGYLASKKIKAVGIDSLGIERKQPNHETHKAFARRGIPIFEGLDLSKVKQGRHFFYGFPLKIKKGDGSPVRAVLVGR